MKFARARAPPQDAAGPTRPAALVPMDVNDLALFYSSPLGEVARRLIGRVLRARWSNCRGMTMVGLGYAGPYLERFRDEAARTLAFMPARMGVMRWPPDAACAAALVEPEMLPVPDGSTDRALVVHTLEAVEHPELVLEEVWRILEPAGRAIFVLPSRRGMWARVDGTPFGHGRPYSRGQLRDLLRESAFAPLHWGEALHAPPFKHDVFVKSAAAFERVGAATGLPFAGVLIVEVTKQVLRPILVRKPLRRRAPSLVPALAHSAQSTSPLAPQRERAI